MDDEVLDSLNHTEWKSFAQVCREITARWEQEGRQGLITTLYNFFSKKETYDTPAGGSVYLSLHRLEREGFVVSLKDATLSSSGAPMWGYKLGKLGRKKRVLKPHTKYSAPLPVFE